MFKASLVLLTLVQTIYFANTPAKAMDVNEFLATGKVVQTKNTNFPIGTKVNLVFSMPVTSTHYTPSKNGNLLSSAQSDKVISKDGSNFCLKAAKMTNLTFGKTRTKVISIMNKKYYDMTAFSEIDLVDQSKRVTSQCVIFYKIESILEPKNPSDYQPKGSFGILVQNFKTGNPLTGPKVDYLLVMQLTKEIQAPR